jgi:3-deoxy-D-manno-octulosonic-acid transferase
MKYFWYFIYNFFFLPAFIVGIYFSSLFNKKVKSGLKGRREFFKYLASKAKTLDSNRRNILIHCASLGEFEQSKPLIEDLDKTCKYNFIVSFFSPSGYNHAKLDFVSSGIIKTYLPFDFKSYVSEFLDIIRPSAVVFVKYDIWFNMLSQIKHRGIFTIVINASLSLNKYNLINRIFYLYKRFVYNLIDIIVVTDEHEMVRFRNLIKNDSRIFVFGDTKYERIRRAKENSIGCEYIDKSVLKNKFVFIVGSSWDKDEEIIFPVINKINSNGLLNTGNIITLIVPHEPSEDNLEEIEYNIRNRYPHLSSIRYSNLTRYSNENVILVDRIGILMGLYKYADIAYVGGGFGSGLHNVLEPAGYGIPVLFGNEKLSSEARELVKIGGGIAVGDSRALYRTLVTFLRKSELKNSTGMNAISVFNKRADVSVKIAELINKYTN